MPEASVELPRYKCHKVVCAVKIASMGLVGSKPRQTIIPVDGNIAPIEVSDEWVAKHKPQAGGYLVIYKDGYRSFSPAEAFEDGYALLPMSSGVNASEEEITEKMAAALYRTYCVAVGGKAFNGDPLPEWHVFRRDESKRLQSDAWMKVAEVALC